MFVIIGCIAACIAFIGGILFERRCGQQPLSPPTPHIRRVDMADSTPSLNARIALLRRQDEEISRRLQAFVRENTGAAMQADPFWLYPEYACLNDDDLMDMIRVRQHSITAREFDDDLKAWVYVLSNYAMPGVVKIGHSISPVDRAIILSRLTITSDDHGKFLNSTSLPRPFKLQFCVQLDNAKRAEHYLHKIAEEHRVHARNHEAESDIGTEFFALSVHQAYLVFNRLFIEYPVPSLNETNPEFFFAEFKAPAGFKGRIAKHPPPTSPTWVVHDFLRRMRSNNLKA